MTDNKYTILDGGMGQELYNRGVTGEKTIWSTNGLLTSPDIVRDIHIDFINAGATVITTNTYCTGPHCLAQVGMEDRYAELTSLACDLAIEARDQAGIKNVKIAGGLPPLYGTYLPNIERDIDAMETEYTQMIDAMAGKVDLFLCETMTTADEAFAAVSAANEVGIPIWVAWTLADDPRGVLRDDSTVTEAYNRIKDFDYIEAYLLNCCVPEAIPSALKELSTLTDKQIGAYANGFAPIPKSRERGDIDCIGKRNFSPAEYAEFAQDWVYKGATIIGGCCEIAPTHIKYISENLK